MSERGRILSARRGVGGLAVAVLLLAAPCAVVRAGGDAAGSHRVVHHFDFDERAGGNLEDEPKFWTPIRLAGFPSFAVGSFDLEVGHAAPPSFKLNCAGRNVAYEYTGPETRVRPNTDYRIIGAIRTENLNIARACLSACYLDRDGRVLKGTLARSRYIGGTDRAGVWADAEIYLPPAPRGARTIGLAAWILQEPEWDTTPKGRRHITRREVHGVAWFDDVTIFALPRVELTVSAAGNVLPAGGPRELRVLLADYADASVHGRLLIRDANGVLVDTSRVAVAIGADTEARPIDVSRFPPGLYHAELEVLASETRIASRHLTFALLAPSLHERAPVARHFGVVIDPSARAAPDDELALMRHLSVRSAKIPVWSGLPEEPPTPAQRRSTDQLLQSLVKSGFSLTAVFAGPPGVIVRRSGPYPPPLFELLAGDPAAWRDYLAEAVVPNAGVFHWWQVGPDGRDAVPDREQMTLALNQLHAAMSKFITVPQLALPVPASVEDPNGKHGVGQVTLGFGGEVGTGQFEPALRQAESLAYEQVAIYVEPLPSDGYRRLPRLADWAQRILSARHAGAATVYLPQPWTQRATPMGVVNEPTEAYLVARTIADVIGTSSPGPTLRIAPGVQCLTFRDGDSTVLALWDVQAPLSGRTHAIQLGDAERQVDIWGKSTALTRDNAGRHVLRLSPLPIFIDGVDGWLIDFRTSLALTPARVPTGTELASHVLEMAYKGDKPLTGTVQLKRGGWEITPRDIEFQLLPRRTEAFPLEMRYPHNAIAGRKELLVHVDLTQPRLSMDVPIAIDFGLADVDVSATAAVDGADVVLTHVVTNRSNEDLSMRGTANVPGRERQYRPFANLRPGDTQTVVYRFAGATALRGTAVRLAIRELNDGPRIHTLELVVP